MLSRKGLIALLIAAAVGTLIAACVSVGTVNCDAPRTGLFGEASPGQSVLLLLSVGAAASAFAFFAVPRWGRRQVPEALAMFFLVGIMGGVWFLISVAVFFAADFAHCPIGQISF
jgi:hypothetical protein